MQSGGFKKVNTKQASKWLEMSEAAAGQFLAKACSFNLLKKVGAGYNTSYELSQDCYNSLQSKLQSNGNDMNSSVHYVVDWFVNHSKKVKAKTIITESGKKFVKVQSTEELDAVSKQAIDQILTIINQNKELKAEVELLKEEIERLKPYEEKYNQIKQLTK
jgi:hypothetical protein